MPQRYLLAALAVTVLSGALTVYVAIRSRSEGGHQRVYAAAVMFFALATLWLLGETS